VEFSEFLGRVNRTFRAHWRGGHKYPYKDILLAAVLLRIAAGKQLTADVVLDGALRALYTRLLRSLFPHVDLNDEPEQPFRHLDANTKKAGVWRLTADDITDARLRSMVMGGADFRHVMAHVSSAMLDERVFVTLAASPEARAQLADLLASKLRAAGARPDGVAAILPAMVLAESEPVAAVEQAEQAKDEVLLEAAIEQYLVDHWAETPFAERGVHLHDRQYNIPTGIVDLLGWQREQHAWWVVELKKGKAEDRVIGQLLRYTGWMRAERLRPKEDVRGVILAREASDRLKYAVTEIPHAEIWTFNDDLTIQPAA